MWDDIFGSGDDSYLDTSDYSPDTGWDSGSSFNVSDPDANASWFLTNGSDDQAGNALNYLNDYNVDPASTSVTGDPNSLTSSSTYQQLVAAGVSPAQAALYAMNQQNSGFNWEQFAAQAGMGLLSGYMSGNAQQQAAADAAKNNLAAIAAQGDQSRETYAANKAVDDQYYQQHGQQLADAYGNYAKYYTAPTDHGANNPTSLFGLLAPRTLATDLSNGYSFDPQGLYPYENSQIYDYQPPSYGAAPAPPAHSQHIMPTIPGVVNG